MARLRVERWHVGVLTPQYEQKVIDMSLAKCYIVFLYETKEDT